MKEKEKLVFEEWIKAMKENGFECESPYDLKNFIEDHGSNSALLGAGLFPDLTDE